MRAETKLSREETSIERLLKSTAFNVFIGAVILINMVLIGVESDIGSEAASLESECTGALGKIKARLPFFILDNVFAFIFVAEMVLRIINLGFTYFCNIMNIVDMVLVLLSATETWILPFVQGCETNQNLRILVTLRIVRILRVVRFFRLIKTFEELWLIVSGLVSALKTVFWVLMLQIIVLYMCAIFATTQIQTPYYFSSVLESMVSLWQIVTLDDWADSVVRPVLRETPALVFFFVPLLFISTFGIFNVIVGIVVENTVQSAQRKSESAQREDEIEKQTALDALKRILELSDPTERSVIRKSDFAALAKLEQVQQKLQIINISQREVEGIFETLSSESDEEISTTDLVAAISQLSGSSFQKDVNQIIGVLNGLIHRISLAETDIDLTGKELEILIDQVHNLRRTYMYFITGQS